jgi:4-amino-4-deoxy-L-arabinose transferase-like glycosyltransferase
LQTGIPAEQMDNSYVLTSHSQNSLFLRAQIVPMSSDRIFNTSLFVLFTITIIVNILGMSMIEVMDEDAAQYASISREMADTGYFLQVKHRGIDYLDKPPLLFWLNALFFKIFGMSHFVYRLPSFLFMILGVFSTFKLGRLLYGRKVGLIAALFFATNQTTFIVIHDVRTDTILTALVVFAIWQLTKYLREGGAWPFILGFVGIGAGMLQKGPIALMIPLLALGADALYRRSWKDIFRWEWLLGLLIIFITLTPMLWGLYQQHGMTGFRFYFWTQSFGRLTGENEWVDSTSYFYFVHTFLWSYLPWTIFALFALVTGFRDLFRGRSSEIITLGGFTLAFIAFSMSQYKLPHYLYVVFPLISVLTAQKLLLLLNTGPVLSKKLILGLQVFVSALLWSGAVMISIFVFPLQNVFLMIILALAFVRVIYLLLRGKGAFQKYIVTTTISILFLNLLLNTYFYPELLKYQAGTQMAHYIKEKEIPLDDFYWFHVQSQTTEYYLRHISPDYDPVLVDDYPVYLCTIPGWKEYLEEHGYEVELVKEFRQFPVTQLSLKFLNKNTRETSLDKFYLIRVLSEGEIATE